MKKLLIAAMLLGSTCAFAESEGGNVTANAGENNNYQSLAERIGGLEKKTDAFNVYFNYAAAFRAEKGGNCFDGNEGSEFGTGFYNKQLRLEIKGNLTDKFYYRLRHRMNKANDAKNDNFAKATDIMMVGYRPSDKFSLQVGKMCQIWGGFEFDENPMSIYQYSDMVENMDNFQAGAVASWTPVPEQEIAVEVSNANNFSFEDQYSWAAADKNIERTKHPLTYILNWNGNFFNGILSTRWAVGYQTQAKSNKSVMVTLGQKLTLKNFDWYVDYMGSFDDIDRLGIVAGETSNYREGCVYNNVKYNSFISKAQYRFSPKWNVFVKGMYETASAPDAKALKNYRTSLGYFAGLEFYPDKSQDLRFSLTYQGRHFSYKDEAKAEYGFKDYDNTRIELGFMYRIKCF